MELFDQRAAYGLRSSLVLPLAAMVLRFKALGIFGSASPLFVLVIRQWASAEPFAAVSVPE
jgi:hypothetical protein